MKSRAPTVTRRYFVAAVLVAVIGLGAGSSTRPFIHCNPAVAYSGDTLTLTMSSPHPAELAVKHPDGTSFFLVYEPGEGDPSGWKPLYSKTEFQSMNEVKLNVSDATGTPWVVGRDANERIFTKQGVYRFDLTETLETEDLPVYSCTVKYRGTRK